MPDLDGIEATRRLLAARRGAAVIMLTTFDLDEYVFAAFRAGASGFLLKDAERHDLVAAVHAAAAGEALLSPSVTRRLIEHFAARRAAAPPPRPAASTSSRRASSRSSSSSAAASTTPSSPSTSCSARAP